MRWCSSYVVYDPYVFESGGSRSNFWAMFLPDCAPVAASIGGSFVLAPSAAVRDASSSIGLSDVDAYRPEVRLASGRWAVPA